jgi:4-hydroxy-2-oxoheptanedioate aldolase
MSAIVGFREALRAGRVLVGGVITFADPLVSEALADALDFLWIDLEHCAMSPEVVAGHLLAGRARGVPTHVRVAAGDTSLVKPALDAGAEGIIVPRVTSVEEVRSIVGDCRYPPLGRRGIHPRVLSNYGRSYCPEFLERQNREVFVTVMIEDAEALPALDDILAVPTLDSVMIGPQDLSASLGYPTQISHPAVLEAIGLIAGRARAAGVFVGLGGAMDPDYARRVTDLGVQWIQHGADYAYMLAFADRELAAVRELVNS